MADSGPPATRASSPRGGSDGVHAPGGKTGGLHKQVMGLPAWMWGVGALVVVGGFLYLRHSASSKASSQQKPAGSGQPIAVVGSPTGLSLEQFLLLLEDMQGGKSKHHGGRHGGGHHHHKPQPGPKEGPEREWLEKKTGSEHPWTWLAQHHERVEVGPHGTRRIVKKRGHR